MLKMNDSKIQNEYKKIMQKTLEQYLQKLVGLRPDFVGYRNFYPDGGSMVYCSNEKWPDDDIKKEDIAFHYAREIILLKRESFKVIIRTPSVANTPFLKGLLSLDMCNSIIVYKKEYGIIHMFCFIFKSSNLATLNFFVNQRERFEEVAKDCLQLSYNISSNNNYISLRENLFSRKVALSLFEEEDLVRTSKEILSSRQRECVDLLSKGATDKDIANILGICPKTVEYHLRNIRMILGCHTRFDISEKVKSNQV
jgi:DNA-binding CsgD family transcriptional regulator